MTLKKQRNKKSKKIRKNLKVSLPLAKKIVRKLEGKTSDINFLLILKNNGFKHIRTVITGYCPSDNYPLGYYCLSGKNHSIIIPFDCGGIVAEKLY